MIESNKEELERKGFCRLGNNYTYEDKRNGKLTFILMKEQNPNVYFPHFALDSHGRAYPENVLVDDSHPVGKIEKIEELIDFLNKASANSPLYPHGI